MIYVRGVCYEWGANLIERLDFTFDSVIREPHELKYIMFRYNLLILHWPLVEGHFWSAIREKYAGKYSCTHKSTSASHEEMDIISQERLNLKAHVNVGFLIQTP